MTMFSLPTLTALALLLAAPAAAIPLHGPFSDFSVNVDSGNLVYQSFPGWNGNSVTFSDSTNVVDNFSGQMGLMNQYVLTFTPDAGRVFTAFYLSSYYNAWSGLGYAIGLSYSIAGTSTTGHLDDPGAGHLTNGLSHTNPMFIQNVVFGQGETAAINTSAPGIPVPASGFTVIVDSYLADDHAHADMYSFGFGATTIEAPLAPPPGAPEPSTLAIFALGLAGLGFLHRKRAG